MNFKRMLASLVFGAGTVASQTAAVAEDKWAIATGSDNGKPLIYRYIMAPPEGVNITQYPNLIAIAWEYDASVRNGMPEQKINERMIQLEDILDAKVESTKNAYLTLSVTGNGRKEWQWYSKDVKETMRLINDALSKQKPFPIKISSQSDPSWTAYFGVVKAVK